MKDNVLISNAAEAKKTRSSRGRQRIEIKKLEDKSKRQVTFSKKNFPHCAGAEVGILTLSKSGRVYTNDNVEPIENMSLVELLEYAMALNDLKKNTKVRVEELSIQKSTCLWHYVADQELNKAQFLQQLMVGGNYDWCRNSDNFTLVEHRH
ncbi:agamous-like MADS-box protein AGL31 [Durio zibethinus]|uniref:Agamous-like MADS-box protein AGL31 n=1 Tax=Durio zibethinus TaxID=66656 RepID=A0A6P6BJ10_DURZI|nr:agamous-like MADS-box protein AGL31 [Durio zibethinus]